MKKIIFFMSLFAIALLSSCSESGEEESEFVNWQARNDTYFDTVYQQAKEAINKGDTNWKIIPGFSKNQQSADPTNFIVVKVLSKDDMAKDEHPVYTDSVKVHYRGYLMPTAVHDTAVEGYPQHVGLQFDSSWVGSYNIATMLPLKGTVNGFIDGFSTALMSMRRGDRWLVFIPQKMGYGVSDSGSIPGYSTLVFDMTLGEYWKKRL